jgi:hypothetical protein
MRRVLTAHVTVPSVPTEDNGAAVMPDQALNATLGTGGNSTGAASCTGFRSTTCPAPTKINSKHMVDVLQRNYEQEMGANLEVFSLLDVVNGTDNP